MTEQTGLNQHTLGADVDVEDDALECKEEDDEEEEDVGVGDLPTVKIT